MTTTYVHLPLSFLLIDLFCRKILNSIRSSNNIIDILWFMKWLQLETSSVKNHTAGKLLIYCEISKKTLKTKNI